MFLKLMVFLLLTIEARRYRYYDAFRARVRMLEVHFIMPVMMRERKLLQGDWKQMMSEDLLLPSFKMSKLKVMLRRLRPNYVWIFLVIAAAWFIKIWIHYPKSHSTEGFVDSVSAHHPLPLAFFWTVGLHSTPPSWR